MSATLRWRLPDHGSSLPYELRKALEKRFDLSGPHTISSDDAVDLAYIEALADQQVPGASDLQKAIEKHGRIELFLTY